MNVNRDQLAEVLEDLASEKISRDEAKAWATAIFEEHGGTPSDQNPFGSENIEFYWTWGGNWPVGDIPGGWDMMGCLGGLIFGFPLAGTLGLFVQSNTRKPYAGFVTATRVALFGSLFLMYAAMVSILG